MFSLCKRSTLIDPLLWFWKPWLFCIVCPSDVQKNLCRETTDGKRDVFDLALFKVAYRIYINSFHFWKNQYVSMRFQCKIDSIVEPCVLSSNRDVLSVFPVGWQNSTTVNFAFHFSQLKLTPAGDWAPLQPVWPGQRTTTTNLRIKLIANIKQVCYTECRPFIMTMA